MDCQITILVLVMSLLKVYCKDERSYFSSGYIGCFIDNDKRILPKTLESKNSNTGKECKDRCKQIRYRYAGTEVGNQCFCGHNLQAIKVPNKGCNAPCYGNRSEHCGGFWRISVYDNEAYKMNKPHDYIGCYKYAHAATGNQYCQLVHNNSDTNTGKECIGRCKANKYTYSGTKYGTECYCCKTLPGEKVSESDCYYTCPGDRDEYCGGDLRLSVHEIIVISSKAKTTPKMTTSTSMSVISSKAKTTPKMTTSTSMSVISSKSKTTPKITTSTSISTFSSSTISQVSPTQELSSTTSYYMTSTALMSTSTPISRRSSVSSSTISQVSPTQELSSTTSYYMTSSSTALMTTSMPTSSRSSVSSSSKYYGKTASKVTFSTTSQQNINVQPTTEKATFSSTSVITGRVSSSAANPITASLSTSHEMSHSTNFTAKDILKNEWVRINDKLLLVVEQEESFPSARNTCMNMGAELLAYSNPMRFFQPSIDKILKNNSYWLGVYTDKLDMECPILYNKNNISSFQLANCSNNNQFICSKSSNVTDEAERLEFEEMLKDMTVERLKTSKAKRKLVSARDKRKSSKSIGASGIFIICAVIAFFVLIDINWRQCHFFRRNV